MRQTSETAAMLGWIVIAMLVAIGLDAVVLITAWTIHTARFLLGG